MVQTQIHHSMLGKLPAYNTTVSDFMGDFSNLFLYCNLRCGGQGSRSACSKESRAQPVPQRRTGRWRQRRVVRTTQLSIYGYPPYSFRAGVVSFGSTPSAPANSPRRGGNLLSTQCTGERTSLQSVVREESHSLSPKISPEGRERT